MKKPTPVKIINISFVGIAGLLYTLGVFLEQFIVVNGYDQQENHFGAVSIGLFTGSYHPKCDFFQLSCENLDSVSIKDFWPLAPVQNEFNQIMEKYHVHFSKFDTCDDSIPLYVDKLANIMNISKQISESSDENNFGDRMLMAGKDLSRLTLSQIMTPTT